MKLGTFLRKTKLHLLVLTPAVTVSLASSRGDIESPPPFAPSVGLQITNTVGTVEFEFTGDLWARTTGGTAAYLQYDHGVVGAA